MRKKITLLIMSCLLYMNGYAQTPFWSDTFEDAGAPSSGTRNASSAFATSADRLFNRTNIAGVSIVGAAVVGTSYAYSGTEGTKFWAGEDTDNAQPVTVANVLKTVTWTINISGKSNIKLKGLFAAGNTVGNGYENGTASSTGVNDYMSMQYSIDGGSIQNLLSFYPLANAATNLFPDNNFDGNGDPATTALNNTFTEFTGNVTGTGTTLTLYLNMSMTGSAEEVAVDNLRLVEVPVASAPTDIALSASALNENVVANTAVGALSSTDPDAGNTFTYTLVAGTGDTDNAAFNISGSSLRISAVPDFEAKSSYSVRIRTTDQGGLTYDEAFTITITNANEAPTDIALSASALNENVVANTAVGALSSTDPDAGNTFTYTLVAGTGDTDNAAFNISGSSLRISAMPDFEAKSSYSVRIRTTDQGGLTYDEAFTITITNINEVPTDIALSASALNENVVANTAVGALSSTDPDAGNTFTYTLVAGTGDTDNAAFNISGSSLRISAMPDFEAKSSYSVRIRTTDQGGLTYDEAFTITITNANEAPTDIALSASALNENVVANTAVGALSSTDPDAGNTFTYTLVAGTGDTDNAAFNISGSSLRISAIPDFEAKSSYSVRIRTTDQGGLTYDEAFTITITNANEAPTDIALSASALNENVVANTAVGALSSTDPDAGNTFTYTLVAGTGDTDNAAFNISGSSLRISAVPDFEAKSSYSVRIRTTDQGGLTYDEAFTITITNANEAPTDIALSASALNENVVANTAVGALSSTDPDAGNTFTYTLVAGTGDTDNAAFNISGSSLRISAMPDFEAKSSYSVRIRTTDQGGLTYDEAFTITITNINEVPTDIALSASALNENVVANTAVGALSSTDPDAGNTFTYTLVAGTGDTDNAAFNISGSSLRISAMPDFEAKSSYSVRIRTTDQGGLTYDEAFTITITNANEAPTDIALSASALNENVVANTAVGALSSTDPDAGNTFTYTLVAGTGDTDNAAFNISGSSLRISAMPDFEAKSSYSVRIRTTDQGGLTYDEAFTITITNINEAPTDIALSASALNENVVANTAVGALSSTDPDAGNTFTYTLVAGTGDTDNAAFNISGSSLRISAIPDFEAKSSYSVRIRTTDQGGLTYDEAFTITITNANEAPTDIALSASALNENVVANTAVGALSSTDPDAGNTFTYTLVAGTGDTDNAAFNISGSSLRISAVPDFEAKSSYSVRIRTTDQGGLTYDEAFTITITNANEAPTDIALSASALNENVVANTAVGALSSTDPDAGNTFTYTLVAGTGDTDNAAFNISGSSLRISAMPDFEAKSSYSVRIRTTDQGGLTYDEAFTITVNDLCELVNLVTQTSGILTATQVGATYQWYNCFDNSPVGTNSEIFTPAQIGDYKVEITIGSCTVTSNCITVTTLDTANFAEKSKFTMYPNPSKGIVNIESDHDSDLSITNQLGQTIKTAKVTSDAINTINIESFADGIYFITEKKGSKLITHKLILKK